MNKERERGKKGSMRKGFQRGIYTSKYGAKGVK